MMHSPAMNLVAGKLSAEKFDKKPSAEERSGPGRGLPQR
jgi:hypothetical protein